MGHSVSIWICECGKKQETTYQDISYIGVPLCPECGEDMDFESEEWREWIKD